MPGTRSPWRLYFGRTLPANVRAVSLTSFLQDVASEMVYPLLPGFLRLLGGGAAALGVMESVAEGVLALVKGWAGRESDRRGRRKPFVVWGYGLSAATRPLLAVAARPLHVVLTRALDRFAKGLRTAPRDAMIADSTPAAQRGLAFSFHRGLDNLGAAVGPLLAAGLLALFPGRLRLVFALATLPALLGVVTVWWRVREVAPTPAVATADSPSDRGRLRLARDLRAPLLAIFLFALGNASDAFLLLRASALGVSAIGLTLLWSGFHVAKWACSVPAGVLVDRLGPGRPLLAGWALYAAVYLGFGFVTSRPAWLALFLAYALYYGLTEGAERTLVVTLAGEGGRGTALGAYHLAAGLGLFFASLLFGVVWEQVSARAAFVMGATLALAAAALLAFTLRAARARSRRAAAP
ncbi:MAG TPA: MFS transporter [Thermoanaerobaculia bacterium]|jgi:MFS family permease|nr:MFS transporter [Thermoanaerobaculia bacterium]